MGASAGGAKGGYQRRNARRRSSKGVMSDINVTPLVDVMLVLLIVFMVAAPMMQQGIPVDLPKTSAGALNEAGQRVKLDVEEGDTVLFGKWSGTEVKIDGKELLIMKESDIMGIISRAKKK